MPTLKSRWVSVSPPGEETYLECVIDIVPRGSGNRRLAVKVAADVFGHERIIPHVISVDVRSSRVKAKLRPGPGLVRDWTAMVWGRMSEAQKREAQECFGDVPGQAILPFPGGGH